ncbi:hypothetical protein Tsp_08693 [Trichinella spiralis]|uniref:hypothetical protein n=1 Tax=Trichinella spiralis TaxID=6334 RepID=UPI0001EFDF39|nr:hypothetical protein Tsp_08693 [Trichinella spiralis]
MGTVYHELGCLFHNYWAVSDETPQSTIIYHCESLTIKKSPNFPVLRETAKSSNPSNFENVFLKNGLKRLDSVRSDSRSTVNLSAPFLIVYFSIFSAESRQLSYALT